jgi:hypothetical protein
VLLVFAAHCQLPSLAGPEHGRTIPLADIIGGLGDGRFATVSDGYSPSGNSEVAKGPCNIPQTDRGRSLLEEPRKEIGDADEVSH